MFRYLLYQYIPFTQIADVHMPDTCRGVNMSVCTRSPARIHVSLFRIGHAFTMVHDRVEIVGVEGLAGSHLVNACGSVVNLG